jgi:hypothetical protein
MEEEASSAVAGAGAVGSEADGMGADDEARAGVDDDMSMEVMGIEEKVAGIGAVPTETWWTRWVPRDGMVVDEAEGAGRGYAEVTWWVTQSTTSVTNRCTSSGGRGIG